MYRETAILEILKDENWLKVPEILDTGVIEGRYYRILEFLEGESMDEYSNEVNFHN